MAGAEGGTAEFQPPKGRTVLSPNQWVSTAVALRLSPRELEVVQCLFDDETEAAIARRLELSVHTVHTYLGRIYAKLGVRSRVQLIVCVFAAHLMTPGLPCQQASADRGTCGTWDDPSAP